MVSLSIRQGENVQYPTGPIDWLAPNFSQPPAIVRLISVFARRHTAIIEIWDNFFALLVHIS